MAGPSEENANSLDEQVDDLLLEYNERLDAGEPISPEDFIAQHDEFREQLSRYFDNVVAVESLAGPRAEEEIEGTVIAGETHDGGFAETMIENSSSGDTARISKDAPLTQFGRYRIRKELGRGAMGAVYLAHDEQLDREVALKIPKFETDTNEELLERFYREARAAAALQHPGICPVHDVGELDGQHYITMAFIKGRPLRDFTKSSKRQKGKQVARVIRKIAMAMAEAHEHNVVHRDLKPANIMINKNNEPVVMDFGLARRSAEGEEQLTHTGTVIGTPAYMSPEQVDGDNEHVGSHSDIYSLGVIFYEMLTGQLPFQGNLMSILKQIALTDPKPPVEIHDDIDPSLQAICLKMMAKKSEDRPASMSDVARDLTMWLQGRQVVADESEPLETSRVAGLAIEPDEPTAPIVDVPVAATVIREPEATLSRQQQESGAGVPLGKRKLLIAGGLGGAALLLAGIVFFVRLGKVNVQITLDHPSLALKVDDGAVVIEGSGKPIRLSAGPHALLVEKDGLLAKTDEFVVRKDGVNSIHVTVVGDEVFILKNGEALPPSIAGTSQGRSRGTRPETPSDFSAVAALNSPEWEWSVPLPLPESINTDAFEASPAFSADGRTLYFTRDDERRGTATTRVLMSMQDGDLNWPDPQPAHDSIQRIKGLQEPHIVASSKSLFFNSEVLPGRVGSNDLFFCKWDDGKARWTAPENLGPTINYRIQDQAPTLTADGLLLLFCSDRTGGPGGMDLWMSERTSSNAMWSRPIPLNAPVNSTATESRPCLLPDGLTLLFTRRDSYTSMRTMWVSTRTDRTAEWQAPVRFTFPTAPNMSMASPAISPDGTILVFVAHHGDSRKSDIWMSRRVRKSSLPTPSAVPDAPPPAVAPFDADQAKAHQQAWADHLGVPVEYTNSIGMKFRLMPPGEFTMGSSPDEIEATLRGTGGDEAWRERIKSEGPQHKVVLTQPVYVGITEVTQTQYEQVMGNNPSHFSSGGEGNEAIANLETGNHPVEMVSGHDAVKFCAKLSLQEKLEPFSLRSRERITPLDGTGYRLPTEAEWEAACRAGTSARFWSGDAELDLNLAGWFGSNSGDRTHATCELKANAFGLFDVHGNVQEWVLDSWDPAFYGKPEGAAAIDPLSPYAQGSLRVIRGGSWHYGSPHCRSSNRYAALAISSTSTIGFRVVLPVDAVRAAIASDPTAESPSSANAPPAAVAPFDSTQAKAHQQDWADYLGVPVEKEVELPGGQAMTFMLIPPGEFMMGSTAEEQIRLRELEKTTEGIDDEERFVNEGPQHRVRITQPFYIGKYEVTVAAALSVLGAQPASGLMVSSHNHETRNPAGLSGFGATELVRQLNENHSQARLSFAIPTEAQWEFAARAGTTSAYCFGDSPEQLKEYAWFDLPDLGEVRPVGQLKPNPWGLHDIYGNVAEWCADAYVDNSYFGSATDDPLTEKANNPLRVQRGGAYTGSAFVCRSAFRWRQAQNQLLRTYGVRLALKIGTDKSTASSVTSAKPASEEPQLTWQDPEQPSKFQLRKSAPDGLIGTMSGHTRFIQRVAFSPDGKRILSSSWNSKLRMHDVETGQELKFKNTQTPPGAFAVDSTFNSVLTFGARDKPAILWDMNSGLAKQQFPGKTQVNWVSLSQDGKLAAIARPSGVSVWNAESGELLHQELGKHTSSARFVDFSADGQKIVTTAGDTLNVFDASSGKRLSTATPGPVAVAQFTTDGKKLVGGGRDKDLFVWDAAKLEPIAQLSGHTDKICSLALTASSRHAVTGSPDRTIRVWDLQEQKQVHEFDARTYNSVHVAVSPDGRHVVSGGGAVPPMGVPADSDYRLHLWKLPTLKGL